MFKCSTLIIIKKDNNKEIDATKNGKNFLGLSPEVQSSRV